MKPEPIRRWPWVIGAFVVLTVFSVSVFGSLGEQFALGWLMFPLSVLPRVTADWPSVIAGLIAFAMFAVGVHSTGRWCASWLPDTLVVSRTWRLRQTGLVVISVTLLFSLGTALVGAVHQILWLSTSRSAPSLTVSDEHRPLSLIDREKHLQRKTHLRRQLQFYGNTTIGNFHSAFKHLPPGGTMSTDGELLVGWIMALGSYLGISHQGADFRTAWNKPPNDRLYRCQLPQFLNPMQPGPVFDCDGFGLTHFAANVHVFPIRQIDLNLEDDEAHGGRLKANDDRFYRNNGSSLQDMTDGTSNTLLIGTVGRNHKPWGYPANVRDPAEGLNRTATGFGGPPGQRSAHFVMADGSVREINDKADSRILKALATPHGGETLVHEKGLWTD